MFADDSTISTMSNTKIALILFGGFTIIGLAASFMAYFFWQRNHHLKTEGITTQATVVGYKTNTSSSTSNGRRRYSTTEAAVVEFTDWQGNRQEVASDVYTSPRRFHTGAVVDIWYDKTDPQQMLIAGTEEWLLTTILAGVGLLFSLVGVPNLFKTIWAMLRPKPQFGNASFR